LTFLALFYIIYIIFKGGVIITTSKKGRQFIDNLKLHELLIEYKKNKEIDNSTRISEELGGLFNILVDNMSYHRRWINYSENWKVEMKSDALYNLCRYAHNFNPEKGTAFNYLSMYIWNAFLARTTKERISNQRDELVRDRIYNDHMVKLGLYNPKDENNQSNNYE